MRAGCPGSVACLVDPLGEHGVVHYALSLHVIARRVALSESTSVSTLPLHHLAFVRRAPAPLALPKTLLRLGSKEWNRFRRNSSAANGDEGRVGGGVGKSPSSLYEV
ncbi:hypothetical protein KSP39_PZI006840 [Platanthera zijinensis]|uniref:Uncharacterized protein n=1 Tax=Platanthera zijinensis TaxID=2320716 RepID=A0AAP0GA77_9ASPA